MFIITAWKHFLLNLSSVISCHCIWWGTFLIHEGTPLGADFSILTSPYSLFLAKRLLYLTAHHSSNFMMNTFIFWDCQEDLCWTKPWLLSSSSSSDIISDMIYCQRLVPLSPFLQVHLAFQTAAMKWKSLLLTNIVNAAVPRCKLCYKYLKTIYCLMNEINPEHSISSGSQNSSTHSYDCTLTANTAYQTCMNIHYQTCMTIITKHVWTIITKHAWTIITKHARRIISKKCKSFPSRHLYMNFVNDKNNSHT